MTSEGGLSGDPVALDEKRRMLGSAMRGNMLLVKPGGDINYPFTMIVFENLGKLITANDTTLNKMMRGLTREHRELVAAIGGCQQPPT